MKYFWNDGLFFQPFLMIELRIGPFSTMYKNMGRDPQENKKTFSWLLRICVFNDWNETLIFLSHLPFCIGHRLFYMLQNRKKSMLHVVRDNKMD